jgi:hypothetical protein
MVLLETLTSRLVGPLLAAAISRRIRLPVAEFLVLETPGRTSVAAFAARGIRALFPATLISRTEILPLGTICAAARTIIPVESLRTIGRGPVAAGTRGIVVFTSGRNAVALTGVWFAGTRMGLLVIGSGALGFAGIGALLALGVARESALGEFLLRAPSYPGAALAGRRPIAPAAAIVVFVIVAGHEGAHFGYSWIGNPNWQSG